MLENYDILNGLNEKMAYLTQRQKVLSTNIANADTPGYRPNDIKTPDFARTLKITGGNSAKLSMAVTAPGHVSGLTHSLVAGNTKTETQRRTYEVSPTGNAVDLEEQMMKASETNMDYQMMTNLYGKNLDLLRTAMRGQH